MRFRRSSLFAFLLLASAAKAQPGETTQSSAAPSDAPPGGGTPATTLGLPGAADPEPPPPVPAKAAAAPTGWVAATPATAPDAKIDPPFPSLKVEGPVGSLRFGFLFQPQFETVGHPTLEGQTNNIFVRRARLLLLANMYKRLEFFLDTDYPDLFKTGPDSETGAKNSPGMFIQDVWGTVDVIDKSLRVDVGYMLPPLSRNAIQGAVNLYGWDYFANSFRHSNVFNSTANPIGRDAGVQLRGLVLDKHLEYRVGLFQGRREAAVAPDVASKNFFRVAGRVQFNFLDGEEFFLYGGTYLGTKKIFSVGGFFDWQEGPGELGAYKHFGADVVIDHELGDGLLTAQVNFQHWNGEDWVALPNQSAIMAEAGYLFWGPKLSPIVRFEHRWVNGESDETRFAGGLAWWAYSHAFNLKAFYSRVNYGDAVNPTWEGFNQFNLQAQFLLL